MRTPALAVTTHARSPRWRSSRHDLRIALWRAAFEQDALAHGAAVFALTATTARARGRYGERADRYALLEAGHAAQNLLLAATALGLGAVVVGAFDDAAMAAALALPPGEQPIDLVANGAPAG